MRRLRFVITGVSRGLGQALARECTRRGHECWGLSRTVPQGPEGLRHSRCDLARPDKLERIADEMLAAGFVPDVLILNAAALVDDRGAGIDVDTAREIFAIDFFGHLRLASRLLGGMESRGKGIVLHTSSTQSLRPFTFASRRLISYAASKTAMDAFFEGLRLHSPSQDGVRFITACLGNLAERRRLPLLSSSYAAAAEEIVGRIERGSLPDKWHYPAAASAVQGLLRLVPGRWLAALIRRRDARARAGARSRPGP